MNVASARSSSSSPLSSAPSAPPSPADVNTGRRRFLGTLAGFAVAGLVLHVVGCTEESAPLASGDAANGGGGCLGKTAADRTGTIGSNHGHAAVVTTAQQDTGTAFDLDIQGTSGHNHTVSLTAQDLADLKAGGQVVKTSSNTAGHMHTVTFEAAVTAIRPVC